MTSTNRRGGGNLARRLLAIPLRWLGLSTGAAALAVSGFFGGLAPTDQPKVPALTVDAANEGKPWTVTVTGARVVDELEPLRLRAKGDRWVVVLAIIDITADESRSDIRDAVRIADVGGLTTEEPAHVYLLRDDKEVGLLHPGLPEKVAFFWEQAGDAAIPTEVRVRILGKTQRPDSFSGRLSWRDPEVRAEGMIEVRDVRK